MVTKEMTNEKLGVATEPSPESLLGAWSFVLEGISPSKPPRGNRTVWQNFSLLFNAIDSDKYLSCNITSKWYVKLARYVKLSVYKHDDRAQSGTTHSGCVYSASWSKTCAGTIFPLFEHNWLKWSCDNYNTQRQLVLFS